MIVDICAHILPGFDPGPKDAGEALEFCRRAAEDRVTDLVAAPHVPGNGGSPGVDEVLEAVEALSRQVDSQGIPIRLHPGAQVDLDVNLSRLLVEGRILTLAQGDRFLAVRLPAEIRPFEVTDFISSLLLQGVQPILVRVEANRVLQRFPHFARELIQAGALLAAAAPNIVGDPESPEVACSHALLRKGLLQFIASDAHGPKEQAVRFSGVRTAVAALAGHEEALKILRRRPAHVLRGEPIPIRSPNGEGNGKRRHGWHFWRNWLSPSARA